MSFQTSPWRLTVIVLFAASVTPRSIAQQTAFSTDAVQVMGMMGVKNNSKGRLEITEGTLSFKSAKNSAADGDRDAAKASDVVSLYATVTKFKQGSELERDVTTVGGSTLITVHCQFKAKDGAVLLERDIQGKVRLIGDNLKATDDFAKKAAKITPESFSAGTASSSGTGPKGGM